MYNLKDDILEEFTAWLYKQPSPKELRDKNDYINLAKNPNLLPLQSYSTKEKDMTFLKMSIPQLFRAPLELNDLGTKHKTVINKCLAYRLSKEEEISPSVKKCGDGLSLYTLISAIHHARHIEKKELDNNESIANASKNNESNYIAAQNNPYRLICAALLQSSDCKKNITELLPTDNIDDHLRPEKSDKYMIYRHIMLHNLINDYEYVTKNLASVLSLLSNTEEATEDDENSIFMQEMMVKAGRKLIKAFKNQEGFFDSTAYHLLSQLAGASTDWMKKFRPQELTECFASIVARLCIIALDNQGQGFNSEKLPGCTKDSADSNEKNINEDMLLYYTLAPFSKSFTASLFKNAGLLRNKYIKRLIYLGLLYPHIVPGSNSARLITAGGYESCLPENSEGITYMKQAANNPAISEILHALLDGIYTYQKSELKALYKDKNYNIDRGLFTFPKELVTLLAASAAEDAYDKKNTHFETLLTKILSVSHWVNLRLFMPSSVEQRLKSAERLSKLYSCRPVTVTRAIASLPPFFEKEADAKDEYLIFNKRKENLLLSKIKVSAAEDYLQAAENSASDDLSEYYITSALKYAKDVKEIAISLGNNLIAANGCILSAEAYADLCRLRCKNHNARMLLADCIIPSAESINNAKILIDSSDVPSCDAHFSTIRREYFDAISYITETFYSEDSPIYKVLSKDRSINIPYTLNYEILKESVQKLCLDEIPDEIKKTVHLWIPHKNEQKGLFRPFYIADLDSELTVRKNLTAEYIQSLIMKMVLSGNTIRLSANQLADNPRLLQLADSPGFLTLMQKGFISLSLYGTVKSLKQYVCQSLENPDFSFSALPSLNYTEKKPDSSSFKNKKKLRENFAKILLGDENISSIPEKIRQELSYYKDCICRFDENLPTASKYYNYQRSAASALTLPEQLEEFFAERKSLEIFPLISKIHETIKSDLPEKFNRSMYKNALDELKLENVIDSDFSKDIVQYLCSYAKQNDSKTLELTAILKELMNDILSNCHNTILGSRISPNIHYTFLPDSKLLVLKNEHSEPLTSEGKHAYSDILRIEETGEAIDFESMISYLSFMEAKVSENKGDFLSDKIAGEISTPSLSYSIDKDGSLALDNAKLIATTNKNLSVTNTAFDIAESTLHLETGRKQLK